MDLITTIEEVQEHCTATLATDINKIKPFINRCERTEIKGLLGDTVYGLLKTAYNSAGNDVTEMSEPDRTLLSLTQEAIVNKTFLSYAAQGQLQISAAGIRISVNENVKTAFQWQINDLKRDFSDTFYAAIESILRHLEHNTASYPAWADTNAYFEQNRFLVRTAADFDRCYNIGESRRTFLSVRYIMQRIEQFHIQPLLGSALLKTLKEANAAKTLTGNQLILVEEYLKPAICLLTIAKGLMERQLSISEEGVQVISTIASTGNTEQREGASRADIRDSAAGIMADGQAFLAEVQHFIELNAPDFPGWALPVIASGLKITNDKDKGIYAV